MSSKRFSVRLKQSGGHVLFAIVILGLAGLLAWQVVPEVLEGRLIEADNYMRLVRVRHLVETGGWFDNSIPRSNAPYGEVLHWTRPLDVLILGTATPLRAFLPLSEALHFAGVLLPPLFLLLLCYAVAWASIPLAGERFQFYAMIATMAQPGVVGYGLPGRIDHHALLFLLFAIVVGLVVRWTSTPFARWLSVSTGATLGLGLWVGPEFLLTLALVLLAGVLAWIGAAEDAGRKNLWLGIGLLGALTVAWLSEHPASGLLVEEYDRISAPHVLVGALTVLFWALVSGVERTGVLLAEGHKGVSKRAFVAILGGLAASCALFLVYPSFFHGPMVEIDPRIRSIWLDLIEERQAWMPPAGLVDVGNLITHLGGAFFCLPFASWVLLREQKGPLTSPWLFIVLTLAVFGGFALFMVRHIPYAEVLTAVVTVSILSRIASRLDSVPSIRLKTVTRAGAAAVLITGPLFLGLAVTALGGQTGKQARDESRAMAGQCPIGSLTSFLLSEERLGKRVLTIAAHLDYGPEILYRTPHQVLGTPYHRNVDGILAGFSILGGKDLGEVRTLAQARAVDLILVCPLQAGLYGGVSEGGDSEPSLHDLLLAGQEPEWLVRIDIPEEVGGAFRLFLVVGSQLSQAPPLSAGEAEAKVQRFEGEDQR